MNKELRRAELNSIIRLKNIESGCTDESTSPFICDSFSNENAVTLALIGVLLLH